ncbi:agmatine deiminase [Candidatus Williamhamiltonella defendens]|uniref:agmatine deiminase n=1 Tax=Candidatus Williamhamiltonella defendens TaxID=138072 RepID=UPI00130E7715|nr:agmatine deiminase [Candidatus Hamiltonella defensa]
MSFPLCYLPNTPQKDGFYMPAEWAVNQAIWMLWPYRHDNWRDHALPVQKTFAQIAETISQTTPVYMGVPATFMSQAKKIMSSQINLVAMNSDDAWVRDTGPTMVTNGSKIRSVHWKFNAWGGASGGLYDDWRKDEEVAQKISQFHNYSLYKAPIILEGGSIHTDGEGTLLTTSECLLHKNRNPDLTQSNIEKVLIEYLGVTHFIWLPEGLCNDETNGHIDNICCFVRPGEVALHWTDNVKDTQYLRSLSAYRTLSKAKDARGRSLKIWKIPAPSPLYRKKEENLGVFANGSSRQPGERLAGSYINFLHTNQQIIFPLLNDPHDTEAGEIFKKIFPNYQITGISAREVLLGGGNIHCVTQQVPK